MQYFSSSLIRLVPSLPLSVWNWFPMRVENLCSCWLLFRHTLRVYGTLGRQKHILFLSLSLCLTLETNLHLVFLCFSLFVFQSTYLKHSVHRRLCGCNNEMPIDWKFSHPRLRIACSFVDTFFKVCATTVQKKFHTFVYFSYNWATLHLKGQLYLFWSTAVASEKNTPKIKKAFLL